MQHQDHVNLIRQGISSPGGTWADLGSGSGAFTLALADLLGPSAHIYSVDKDARSLHEQATALATHFPAVSVTYQRADFTRKLALPELDGILMANSLHYVSDQAAMLALVRSYLRPSGRLILVEYNADRGNMWVPYPISYPTWETFSARHGFIDTHLLMTVPSRFLQEIYAAVSLLPPDK